MDYKRLTERFKIWPYSLREEIRYIKMQLHGVNSSVVDQTDRLAGDLEAIRVFITLERNRLHCEIDNLRSSNKEQREISEEYRSLVREVQTDNASYISVANDAIAARAYARILLDTVRAELDAAKLIISIQQSMISVKCTLAEQMQISDLSLKSLDKFGVDRASFIGSFPAGDALVPSQDTTVAPAATASFSSVVDPTDFTAGVDISEKMVAGLEVTQADIVDATMSPTEQEFNEAMGAMPKKSTLQTAFGVIEVTEHIGVPSDGKTE